uniref:Uncharacterized protein n=1 Tax=Steinernema glaseri TaxID=37863 RepID=A0A1I7Z6B7_9BILA
MSVFPIHIQSSSSTPNLGRPRRSTDAWIKEMCRLKTGTGFIPGVEARNMSYVLWTNLVNRPLANQAMDREIQSLQDEASSGLCRNLFASVVTV